MLQPITAAVAVIADHPVTPAAMAVINIGGKPPTRRSRPPLGAQRRQYGRPTTNQAVFRRIYELRCGLGHFAHFGHADLHQPGALSAATTACPAR